MTQMFVGIHRGHNSAVAVLEQDAIRFAMQEERLTRVKNQGGLPELALREAFKGEAAGSNGNVVNFAYAGSGLVSYYWKREDVIRIYGTPPNRVLQQLKRSVRKSEYLAEILDEPRSKQLGQDVARSVGLPDAKISRFDHHLCHAASAYFGWGRMDESILVLTCDGAGDGICASVNIGKGGTLKRIASVELSHSIGRLYSNLTYLMGMVPLEHEYKLMGLAPYAERSKPANNFADELGKLFAFDKKNPMVWKRTGDCPPLQDASSFLSKLLHLRRFDHIAAGLQVFTERFLVDWVRACIRETGIRKVALSGGVFMNVKANQKILEIPELEELFVFPSCGDETNAMGAAWLLQRKITGSSSRLADLYTGPEFDNEAIEKAIRKYPFANAVAVTQPQDIERSAAELLAKGEVVARFKGRMEFGARALGNRSILANASHTSSVRVINDMIKSRDFWMPFAPSVLAEQSERYFIKPKRMDAPYMIITFDTRPEKRERIIAAIHPYDCTGRPQEVRKDWNPDYYRLIQHYESLTGEALILNTSFNLHGEPVVCSPEDALRVFDISGLQHLAIGDQLLSKRAGSPGN